ncbi:MAG: hypothetical protein ABI559_05575 [Chloroflexota bacterium]
MRNDRAQFVLERTMEDGSTIRHFLCLDCREILDVGDEGEYEHQCDGEDTQNGESRG